MAQGSETRLETCIDTKKDEQPCSKAELEIEEECYDLFDKITWKKPQNLGLFYDKVLESFTHRMVFGAAAVYPFFGVYLNLPGHMFSAISSVFAMFWSLKFFWAFVIDSKTIRGKNRIYFMAIGWTISALSYAVVCFFPYPQSYYPVVDCKLDVSTVQNPDTQKAAILYISAMAFGIFGVGCVDLTSDALVVEYTKKEPLKSRGTSNAYAHIAGCIGGILLFVVVGTGLNSPAYGGKFCNLPITYQHILVIFLVVSLLGILNSCFLTKETKTLIEKKSYSDTCKGFWNFMQYRVFQRCALVFLIVPMFFGTRSSAQVKIRKNWAKVEPFMGAMSAIGSNLLVALGMFLIQRFFLQKSWVKITVISQLYCILIALAVESLTIFDVVRNQFFYFSEELLSSVAFGISMFVMLQLAAELSDPGLEALIFGMMMTNWTISHSFGKILGNIISTPFDVTGDERYFRDSMDDRWNVFGSVAVACFVNSLAIPLFAFLCPKNRDQIVKQKKGLGKSKVQACLYVATFAAVYLTSLLYNALIMIPSVQCSPLLGGKGCS